MVWPAGMPKCPVSPEDRGEEPNGSAHAPSPQTEAVAWRYRYKAGDCSVWMDAPIPENVLPELKLEIAYPQPQQQQADVRAATIEECAKIADPWPGFNVGQKITEPDLSVIDVRNKIAAAIRALAVTRPECK